MNAATKKRPPLASGCTCRDNADHCEWCQATEAAIEAGETVKPLPRTVTPEAPPATPPAPPAPMPRPLPPLAARWLTAEETAEVLNMGTRTIWRLVALGRMPQPVRYTRKLVRFSGAALAAWMKQQSDDAQRTR